MERARWLALVAVGVAAMLLTTGLVVRLAAGGDTVRAGSGPTSTLIDLSGDAAAAEVAPDAGLQPGDPPPPSSDPLPVPAVDAPVDTPPTLPAPYTGVATIPLPDLSTGATTGTAPSSTARPPAFSEPGVWLVRTDGTGATLVSRGATAGVAAGGTWVGLVDGGAVWAVRRADLRTKVRLGTGVGGGAAQGLPIAGGKGGVAFLQGGRAVLVDPAAPATPAVSVDAPGAVAVAAEEDGEGRLVWADGTGIHVGQAEPATGAVVQRGVLVMGHGFLAHLEGGQVRLRGGPNLAWGEVDRLATGPAGMVAASGGAVRLRTAGGQDRVLLERATTPVLSSSRIFYVSAGRTLASATLTGTGAVSVATAAAGRSIANLDLLDDTTLVVTVA